MINIINFTCNDNPPWPPGEGAGRSPRPAPPLAPVSVRPVGAIRGGPGRHGVRAIAARVGRTAGLAVAVALSWLAFAPRRLGDHLFAMNDSEAYWRGWQLTKTPGGLGRRYRDPLFGTLAECPACRGAGAACARCLGSGRMTVGEVS